MMHPTLSIVALFALLSPGNSGEFWSGSGANTMIGSNLDQACAADPTDPTDKGCITEQSIYLLDIAQIRAGGATGELSAAVVQTVRDRIFDPQLFRTTDGTTTQAGGVGAALMKDDDNDEVKPMFQSYRTLVTATTFKLNNKQWDRAALGNTQGNVQGATCTPWDHHQGELAGNGGAEASGSFPNYGTGSQFVRGLDQLKYADSPMDGVCYEVDTPTQKKRYLPLSNVAMTKASKGAGNDFKVEKAAGLYLGTQMSPFHGGSLSTAGTPNADQDTLVYGATTFAGNIKTGCGSAAEHLNYDTTDAADHLKAMTCQRTANVDGREDQCLVDGPTAANLKTFESPCLPYELTQDTGGVDNTFAGTAANGPPNNGENFPADDPNKRWLAGAVRGIRLDEDKLTTDLHGEGTPFVGGVCSETNIIGGWTDSGGQGEVKCLYPAHHTDTTKNRIRLRMLDDGCEANADEATCTGAGCFWDAGDCWNTHAIEQQHVLWQYPGYFRSAKNKLAGQPGEWADIVSEYNADGTNHQNRNKVITPDGSAMVTITVVHATLLADWKLLFGNFHGATIDKHLTWLPEGSLSLGYYYDTENGAFCTVGELAEIFAALK